MQRRFVCCVHIYPFLAPPLYVASGDYTAISSEPVTFTSAPDTMCVSVSISNDNVVEAAELFAVTLGSADPAVVIAQPFSSVTIIDSTGKHLLDCCLVHIPQQKYIVYFINTLCHVNCSMTMVPSG